MFNRVYCAVAIVVGTSLASISMGWAAQPKACTETDFEKLQNEYASADKAVSEKYRLQLEQFVRIYHYDPKTDDKPLLELNTTWHRLAFKAYRDDRGIQELVLRYLILSHRRAGAIFTELMQDAKFRRWLDKTHPGSSNGALNESQEEELVLAARTDSQFEKTIQNLAEKYTFGRAISTATDQKIDAMGSPNDLIPTIEISDKDPAIEAIKNRDASKKEIIDKLLNLLEARRLYQSAASDALAEADSGHKKISKTLGESVRNCDCYLHLHQMYEDLKQARADIRSETARAKSPGILDSDEAKASLDEYVAIATDLENKIKNCQNRHYSTHETEAASVDENTESAEGDTHAHAGN